MAIALQVLKIIGIVLLWVIGILLALLLLLLFWPYGYRIRASKYKDIRAQAGVTWFFRFVTADLLYEEGVNFRIRVLGIPLYDKRRKARKAEEKERRLAEKAAKQVKNAAERTEGLKESLTGTDKEGSTETLDRIEESRLDGTEHSGHELDGENFGTSDFVDDVDEENSRTDTDISEAEGFDTLVEKDRKPSLFERVKNRFSRKHGSKKPRDKNASGRKKTNKTFKRNGDGSRKKKPPFDEWCEEQLDRIEEKAEALSDTIRDGSWELGDTVDRAFDTYHYYERVLESDGTAWVVEYVKKHLLAILKPLKPRRFDLDLDHRSTDPVQVAKVMEYYALSIPLTDDIRGKIRVTSLIDEDRIEGNAGLKGSFILGSILWHAFLLWRNKKVRHFIKVIKREQGNGN